MLEVGKTGIELKWASSRVIDQREAEKSDLIRVDEYDVEIVHRENHRKGVKNDTERRSLMNWQNGRKSNGMEENRYKMNHVELHPGYESRMSIRENMMQRKQEITSKRKYIFTLRYYEQLAGATKNLIDLASLARHFNRHVVMPFINNSRMNGIEQRDHYRTNKAIFSNLSRYFDIKHLNATLVERGYAPLSQFNDFIDDCKRGLDVLVHFIYNDSFSSKDAKKWFGIDSKSWIDLREKMPKFGGVQTCNFLKQSRVERLLGGVTIDEYLCVDPEIVRTAIQMENVVFRKRRCIGILQWKGGGNQRTHFPLPQSVYQKLKPSDILHNRTLIDIAKNFIKNNMKTPFLAIHIRAERQLSWYGLDRVVKCVKTLAKKVFQRKRTFQIESIYLATDLPVYGSDTYKNDISSEREIVQRYVRESLKKPKTFQPELYGIHDKGEISLIEMNILSFGESLYTIGGGKFQQWVVELFLAHNTEDHSLLHRICLEKLK